MALNATKTGKSIADYVAANAPSPDAAVTPTQLVSLWQGMIGILFADLESDGVITCTIEPSTIVTVGSPASQTGPQAPLPIMGTIA